MRNDITFLEATYAAAMLGAYAVPVNWHLKADEVRYILDDCEAKVLVAHEDLLRPLAGHLPDGLAVFSVPVPPEVIRHFPAPAGCRRCRPRRATSTPGLPARRPSRAQGVRHR